MSLHVSGRLYFSVAAWLFDLKLGLTALKCTQTMSTWPGSFNCGFAIGNLKIGRIKERAGKAPRVIPRSPILRAVNKNPQPVRMAGKIDFPSLPRRLLSHLGKIDGHYKKAFVCDIYPDFAVSVADAAVVTPDIVTRRGQNRLSDRWREDLLELPFERPRVVN